MAVFVSAPQAQTIHSLQRAVRDERWKLIVYPKVNNTQIFDLRADPAEMHDIAAE